MVGKWCHNLEAINNQCLGGSKNCTQVNGKGDVTCSEDDKSGGDKIQGRRGRGENAATNDVTWSNYFLKCLFFLCLPHTIHEVHITSLYLQYLNCSPLKSLNLKTSLVIMVVFQVLTPLSKTSTISPKYGVPTKMSPSPPLLWAAT